MIVRADKRKLSVEIFAENNSCCKNIYRKIVVFGVDLLHRHVPIRANQNAHHSCCEHFAGTKVYQYNLVIVIAHDVVRLHVAVNKVLRTKILQCFSDLVAVFGVVLDICRKLSVSYLIPKRIFIEFHDHYTLLLTIQDIEDFNHIWVV